jgi:CDP-diacylglycerol--glycerol-3-phosphate 3-phosphatidyltransferase
MKLKHLPNIISTLRLLTVPVLVWLAAGKNQTAFAWLILVAGLTDVLDGSIARHFGWTSRLGAALDSIADVLLILVALFGVWAMHPHVIVDEWPVFAGVSAIWMIVHCFALYRYGRLASFHTRLSQVGILLFGLVVLLLFFHAFVPWFFYFAAAISFAGGLESLVLIALIPQWTPDIRGGLLQYVRERGTGNIR